MANIHIFLQGKGGVGKSFSCAMLAQYLLDRNGPPPICIDTDPVNATFAAFSAFNVHRMEIMDGDQVNARKFDPVINMIAAASETDTVVIDNGASSFIPFAGYLLSAGIPELLAEMGHNLYANTVITGGDAMEETVKGFASIISQFPDSAGMNVWLNPYFGAVLHNGKRFEEMPAYTKHKAKINAIIQLPELQTETFGYDLSAMLKAKMTFAQALNDESGYDLMAKQRLKMIRRTIYAQLDSVPSL